MILICHTVYLADISYSKEMSVVCHEKKQKFKRVTPFALPVCVVL